MRSRRHNRDVLILEGGCVPSHESDTYFPPPESMGGWRHIANRADIRRRAGMDADKLDLVLDGQGLVHGGESWSIVIIRRGILVRELHTFNVLFPTRFDIW